MSDVTLLGHDCRPVMRPRKMGSHLSFCAVLPKLDKYANEAVTAGIL